MAQLDLPILEHDLPTRQPYLMPILDDDVDVGRDGRAGLTDFDGAFGSEFFRDSDEADERARSAPPVHVGMVGDVDGDVGPGRGAR